MKQLLRNSMLLGIACLASIHGASAFQHLEDTKSRAMVVAQQGASLAGAARYCQVDEELVDEFITTVEARIALVSNDDYEKILSRLEFKNLLAATSAKEPEEGCETLSNSFTALVKQYQ